MRLYLDQSAKSYFRLLPDEELDRCRRRLGDLWQESESEQEDNPERIPSDVQFSAVSASMRKKRNGYADPAVFRPDSDTFVSDLSRGADSLRQARLAGPGGYTDWKRFWTVYGNALIGLKVATFVAVRKYAKVFSRILEDYPGTWQLLRRADYLMRRQRFSRYLRQARTRCPEELRDDNFRDGNRSLEYCLRRAASDDAFWQNEVLKQYDRINQGIITLADLSRPGYGELRWDACPEPLPAARPLQPKKPNPSLVPDPPALLQVVDTEDHEDTGKKLSRSTRRRHRIRDKLVQLEQPAAAVPYTPGKGVGAGAAGQSAQPWGGRGGGGGKGQGQQGGAPIGGRGKAVQLPKGPFKGAKGGKFIQGKTGIRPPTPRNAGPGDCWEWMASGTCVKGDKCRFAHPSS